MIQFDIEAIRAEVRAMDYVRGTPAEVAQWREDDEDSRADHFIEGIEFTPDEDALFAMLMDEAVPPPLVTRIIDGLLDANLLADHLTRHAYGADGRPILPVEVEQARARVRDMEFTRGTPAQVAGWRETDAGRRAYLVSKGLLTEPADDALFAMFMDEAVPPDLCALIVAELRERADAGPASPVAPIGAPR